MENSRIKLQKIEIQEIAMNYISNHPSTVFTFEFIHIQNTNRYPCWSVVFEMKNKEGNIVDGPLILGIDKFGEIIYVG